MKFDHTNKQYKNIWYVFSRDIVQRGWSRHSNTCIHEWPGILVKISLFLASIPVRYGVQNIICWNKYDWWLLFGLWRHVHSDHYAGVTAGTQCLCIIACIGETEQRALSLWNAASNAFDFRGMCSSAQQLNAAWVWSEITYDANLMRGFDRINAIQFC